MKIRKFNIIGVLYIALLFFVYEIMLRVTGFSINTAVYGLFVILIFFYYITGNLNFYRRKVTCNSVFINSLIFGIFFLFYKSLSIFMVFIAFSIFQILLYRLIIKLMDRNKEKGHKIINIRSVVKFGIDSTCIIGSMIIAFIYKYESNWEANFKWEYIFAYLGIFLIGYFYTRMNDRSWSYTNILDVFSLIVLNGISALVFFIVVQTRLINYPALTLILSLILSIAFQLFCRYIFRLKRFYNKKNKGLKGEERVLVYGAGEAGIILAREAMNNPGFPYHIVGFLDDDSKKKDTYIYNIKVLGDRSNLEEVIKRERVSEVLLALPSIHSFEMRNIVDRIKAVGKVEIKTVPSITEILENKELVSQIRNVKIEDLLGRDEIVINDMNIKKIIENKVIFVTGAAGSIGSELVRQIARYSPQKLVNIDINENDLYFLELEIKRKYPQLNLVSEICNIREKDKVEYAF